MSLNEQPYDGTLIGADGKRYANDNPSIPTEPPPAPGRPIRQEEVLAQVNRVASLDRSITDGVTVEDSTTYTSATAKFSPADVGAAIEGENIPAGTTIASVTSATTVVLSAAATASDTGLDATITRSFEALLAALSTILDFARPTRTVTDGVLNSTTAVDSNNANFTSADVGASIAGAGIPVGATIASVTDENTIVLSAAATATGTGRTLVITQRLDVVLSSLLTRVATLEAA